MSKNNIFPHEWTVEQTLIQRRAVRNYHQDQNISSQELQKILKLATYAPSSWNLQHWYFLVVSEKEMKEKLYAVAHQQNQILDASAVIIVLGDLEAYRNFEQIYQPFLAAGFMDEERYFKMKTDIYAYYENNSSGARDEAIRNASLCAMQLMIAAKAQGYDTCPMIGFEVAALIDRFNIPPRYIPVMLISIGRATGKTSRTARLPLQSRITMEHF
ncbi:nitroreductase family protein [Polycladospora coralii]|uniref:nitroreductase family protein n=1 Tax=Polycladospora coralii TaxID=2771432 RepID=UPI0034E2C655